MSEHDLSDQIAQNASGPKKVSGDAGSVEQHSLKDQIDADRHLKGQNSLKSGKRGFILGRFKPGGTT